MVDYAVVENEFSQCKRSLAYHGHRMSVRRVDSTHGVLGGIQRVDAQKVVRQGWRHLYRMNCGRSAVDNPVVIRKNDANSPES